MSIQLNQGFQSGSPGMAPPPNGKDSEQSALTVKVEQLQPSARLSKAKEAEDLLKPLQITTRQSTDDQIKVRKVQKTEKEEIASRSAEIWECVSRKPNKLGGYIYGFKIRPEYEPFSAYNTGKKTHAETMRTKAFDALKEKSRMIYPAVEVNSPPEWTDLILERLPEDYSLVNPDCDKLPKELGFSHKGKGKDMLVYIPDREAVMANWGKLRDSRPELPPLNVATGEGIAGDLEFAEAYFTHDVLLSTGKEFFHDWAYHVTPTLLQMVRIGCDFSKERARMVKLLAKTRYDRKLWMKG